MGLLALTTPYMLRDLGVVVFILFILYFYFGASRFYIIFIWQCVTIFALVSPDLILISSFLFGGGGYTQ